MKKLMMTIGCAMTLGMLSSCEQPPAEVEQAVDKAFARESLELKLKIGTISGEYRDDTPDNAYDTSSPAI